MTNSNAYHIVIKCISSYEEYLLNTLFKKIKTSLVDISNNRIGCCSIQKCIETSSSVKKSYLVNKATKNTMKLISDPHGHYVLLHIMSFENQNDFKSIISKIKNEGNIKVLAKQRYSSIILDRCLDYIMDKEIKADLIDLFCTKSVFKEVICDAQYGNNCKYCSNIIY